MSHYPHPDIGNRNFPRKWTKKTWNEILDIHLHNHARGLDNKIGFDDDDRLCVVYNGDRSGRGRYAIRIPSALVEWTEREMQIEGIVPVPNHSKQLRQRRGKGGSLESDTPLPDRAEIIAFMAERAGVKPECLDSLLQGHLVNMDFGCGMPVKTAPLQGHQLLAYGYAEQEKTQWAVEHGVIERDIHGVVSIQSDRLHGNIRTTHGGTLHALIETKIENHVETNIKLMEFLESQGIDPSRKSSGKLSEPAGTEP